MQDVWSGWGGVGGGQQAHPLLPLTGSPPLSHCARPPFSKPVVSRQFLAARPAPKAQRQGAVQTRAMATEVATIAGEAGFIFGVSGVMVGITLIVSGSREQRSSAGQAAVTPERRRCSLSVSGRVLGAGGSAMH